MLCSHEVSGIVCDQKLIKTVGDLLDESAMISSFLFNPSYRQEGVLKEIMENVIMFILGVQMHDREREGERMCMSDVDDSILGVPHIAHCSSWWSLMIHSSVCVWTAFVLYWGVGVEILQRTFTGAPLWPQASHGR